MNAKYLVILNMPGYLPDSEPIECSSLSEAKQAVKDEIASYVNDDYTWDKWENMSYLKASDFTRYGSFTIGVLMPIDASEYTLGIAVNIARIIE